MFHAFFVEWRIFEIVNRVEVTISAILFRYVTFARNSFNIGASTINIGTAKVLGLHNRNNDTEKLEIREFSTWNKSRFDQFREISNEHFQLAR